jgi:DNA-binding CsgD family transcriptional regulator
LLARTFADPVRTAVAALGEADAVLAGAGAGTDPGEVVRIGTASVYIDRLADSREAFWEIVRLGRAGGPARRQLGATMHLCLDGFLTGRWTTAWELAQEGLALCDEHGYRFFAWYFRYNEAVVAAGRGAFAAARELADRITEWAVSRGVHGAELFAEHPRVLAAMGEGAFGSAYEHATAMTPPGVLASHAPHALWTALDLVEAAMRMGRSAAAAAHVAALRAGNVAALSGRMAMLVNAADALVSGRGELFEAALGVPGAALWVFEHARVRLLYGEHLRRCRATTAARSQLTAARQAFDRLGARPWSARAEAELRATGTGVVRGGPHGSAGLTPQELQIAELAAGGLTNKQIGVRLFLSPRTVSTHLYVIFPKLGITSRSGLRDALGRATPSTPQ